MPSQIMRTVAIWFASASVLVAQDKSAEPDKLKMTVTNAAELELSLTLTPYYFLVSAANVTNRVHVSATNKFNYLISGHTTLSFDLPKGNYSVNATTTSDHTMLQGVSSFHEWITNPEIWTYRLDPFPRPSTKTNEIRRVLGLLTWKREIEPTRSPSKHEYPLSGLRETPKRTERLTPEAVATRTDAVTANILSQLTNSPDRNNTRVTNPISPKK